MMTVIYVLAVVLAALYAMLATYRAAQEWLHPTGKPVVGITVQKYLICALLATAVAVWAWHFGGAFA